MAEPNAAAEPSSESYAAEHATAYKVKGNGLFKEGDFAGAVAAYSEAIALDPGNGVLYSNRSGAYLALGGAVSKAFKDAEECVRLRPDWPKAYGRRGAAEAALTRFVAAQSSYRRALDLDPRGNPSFEEALAAARAGEEQQTKERIAEELRREAAEKAAAARRAAAAEAERKAAEDRAVLGDFFGALETDADVRRKAKKQASNPTTKKYVEQKLGTAAENLARLTPAHATFKNLNPFRVLMLDTDATPDDIKMRYRKLSALCHPDKNGGAEEARVAFEFVKDAHETLADPKKRDRAALVVEGAKDRCRELRAFELTKDGVEESSLPPLEEALEREVMKTFAQNEMKRRDVVDHQRTSAARERTQADAADAKAASEKTFEKQWNADDRRADRVDFWQSFQDDAARSKNVKRQRAAVNFKAEATVEKKPKYGQSHMESWKKDWK